MQSAFAAKRHLISIGISPYDTHPLSESAFGSVPVHSSHKSYREEYEFSTTLHQVKLQHVCGPLSMLPTPVKSGIA
jgi:hypothetical protein